jgi:hypothetical protein
MVYTIYGDFENSVPLNPMVNDQTIPIKWLFVWEYTLFSDKPIYGDFGDGRWHCFTTLSGYPRHQLRLITMKNYEHEHRLMISYMTRLD